MDANSAALFLSAVTVLEVQAGIAKADREGARQKAEALAAWLEATLHLYGERVLALGIEVAKVAGDMSDKAKAMGRSPGLADIAIAATAAHHGLTVLTRNVKHFADLGVTLHDPFLSLPH